MPRSSSSTETAPSASQSPTHGGNAVGVAVPVTGAVGVAVAVGVTVPVIVGLGVSV